MINGKQAQIFGQALNLQKPWVITQIEFKKEEKRLDIWIDFERGAKYPCPECGQEDCNIHDTINKEWRHLDFFSIKHTFTVVYPE